MIKKWNPILKTMAGLAARSVPDIWQIALRYRMAFGRWPDLKNPVTFNEYIQWMKIRDRNPLYPVVSDKFAVRDYVKNSVGEEVLNELIGVYHDADEIDFTVLPDRFVIKANHSCARNLVCRDKSSLDIRSARRSLHSWLKEDYSRQSFGKLEWQYRDIPRKLICEKYLEDSGGKLADYKFFCFHGRPEFVQVDIDRTGFHQRNIYTSDWQPLDLMLKYPRSQQVIAPPPSIRRMLECAGLLSKGFPFIRADFYDVDGQVVFGELTLSPGSGYVPFVPARYDREWGSLILQGLQS